MSNMARYVLWLYLGASLVTFVAYALDKSAAVTGRGRTSERRLLLLGLLGGWPGALLAQWRLRHKTRKWTFLVAFWASVLVNVTVVRLLLTVSH